MTSEQRQQARYIIRRYLERAEANLADDPVDRLDQVDAFILAVVRLGVHLPLVLAQHDRDDPADRAGDDRDNRADRRPEIRDHDAGDDPQYGDQSQRDNRELGEPRLVFVQRRWVR